MDAKSQPRQFRMDPWTSKLPIGGALRTLDSGQSFRGPVSKVVLIPACDQTHLGCRPGRSDSELVNAMPSCCCDGCCCRCCCCVTDCPSILLRTPASGCTRSRSTEKDSRRIVVCRAHRASPLFRDAGACSQFGHLSCHIMGMAWYRMAETLPVDSAARMCGTVRNCTGLYRPYRI